MPCINTNHAHDDRVQHIMSYLTVADLACNTTASTRSSYFGQLCG